MDINFINQLNKILREVFTETVTSGAIAAPPGYGSGNIRKKKRKKKKDKI